MLTAKKNYLFESLFGFYNKNLLKRYFNSLYLVGLQEIQDRAVETPLIIYSNHSNWWDGLVCFEISRKLKLDSYFMMEEKNLKKLSIFRRLGAFSVLRESARDAVKSLNYAANILESSPAKALWIFPQGEILVNDTRPLKFYNGISRVIQKTGKVQVVSMALRFEFLDSYKPDIFIKIGKLQRFCSGDIFDSKKTTLTLADMLMVDLDQLKNSINDRSLSEFENLI